MRFIIFISLVILITGCDENINDPSDLRKDFLPLNIGNYWIYQFHQLDMNNQVIGGSQYIDSLVVENIIVLESDIPEYTLVFYKDRVAYDTLELRKSNNQIFFYLNPNTNISNSHKRWLPLINLNMEFDESWNIFNEQFIDYVENLNGKEYKGTYFVTDNGRLVSEDSILFNESLYFSKFFNHKYDSKLQFNIYEKRYTGENTYVIDTIVYNKIYKYTEEFRLLEGIGFSRMAKNPHRLTEFTNPSSTISSNQDFLGWERLLLRYNVKN